MADEGLGNKLGDRLRSFVERIERLNVEVDALNADKKEIFAEAKGAGFIPKIMKMVIHARRQDPEDRKEQLDLFDTYMMALDGKTTALEAAVSDGSQATEADDSVVSAAESADEGDGAASDPGSTAAPDPLQQSAEDIKAAATKA